jgi:hypothetical protein
MFICLQRRSISHPRLPLRRRRRRRLLLLLLLLLVLLYVLAVQRFY